MNMFGIKNRFAVPLKENLYPLSKKNLKMNIIVSMKIKKSKSDNVGTSDFNK